MSNRATGDTINAIEFETPFTIYPDGTFKVLPYGEVYAPEAWSAAGIDIDVGPDWTALTGMSRQDRYAGAVMHSSEYIGDGIVGILCEMAEDEPVTFAVVTVDWMAEEGEESDESDYAYGWAIVYKN